MNSEWDEAKRLANTSKHDLDFADATVVFEGNTAEFQAATVNGETRWMVTGILDGRYVTVICRYRDDDLCRIISFRRARVEGRKRHQALHGG